MSTMTDSGRTGVRWRSILLATVLTGVCGASAQEFRTGDPCGYPDTTSAFYRAMVAPGWGYGFDTLRKDLTRWAASPFVRVDSIGESTQHRGLFMLTIQDTGMALTLRKRVWIHARTHPIEVQGTWVTNEIIALLLSDAPLARTLRAACVFNILPMYNPDGVELMKQRENANNVDIESNWAVVPGEKEVQVLRGKFAALMTEPNPVQVALNMHSAYGNERYFVYHAETGTSSIYAATEQRFINSVRSYFPGGIMPWSFFVSWVSGPSTSYPESWFWSHSREAVLALTYEDKNSATAGAFDSTAFAILHGVGDHLGVTSPTGVEERHPGPSVDGEIWCYPTPFNGISDIGFRISELSDVKLQVYDLLGREVTKVLEGELGPGTYTARLDLGSMASGMYVLRLQHAGGSRALRIVLTR